MHGFVLQYFQDSWIVTAKTTVCHCVPALLSDSFICSLDSFIKCQLSNILSHVKSTEPISVLECQFSISM